MEGGAFATAPAAVSAPVGDPLAVPETRRTLDRRLARSIAFLVLGVVGPSLAIGCVVAVGTEDGLGVWATIVSIPVGLFMVVSFPSRSREVRRMRTTLRQSRWRLVSVDHVPHSAELPAADLLFRAIDGDGHTTFWRSATPTRGRGEAGAGWRPDRGTRGPCSRRLTPPT